VFPLGQVRGTPPINPRQGPVGVFAFRDSSYITGTGMFCGLAAFAQVSAAIAGSSQNPISHTLAGGWSTNQNVSPTRILKGKTKTRPLHAPKVQPNGKPTKIYLVVTNLTILPNSLEGGGKGRSQGRLLSPHFPGAQAAKPCTSTPTRG